MSTDPEERILFAVTELDAPAPLVVMGLPAGAWEYMQDGKTHTFDLTKIGIPVRIVLYGGPDANAVKAALEGFASAQGLETVDRRDEDMSIRGDRPN